MDEFRIADVALLSEEAALRRGADANNLTRIRIFLTLFAMVAVAEILYSLVTPRATVWDRILSISNLLLTIVAAGTCDVLGGGTNKLTRGFAPIAGVVARNVRPWIIGIVAVQYLLFMLFTNHGGWTAWSFLFPVATAAFRLAPAEFVLLHGFFLAVTIVEGLLIWARDRRSLVAILVIASTANIIVLLVSIVSTRRFRRDFVTRWRREHESAVDRARMRDELSYARELQLSMLPCNPPDIDWLDVAAVSLPATEVGGDYFDYFRITDRRLAIVCGDVAGHGLGSGIVLAALRAGFTLLRDSLDDPVYVLRRLAELVSETSRRRMLVSLAILLLDEERGVATVASAGHPPLLFRSRDGVTEAIEMFAPPLGARLRHKMITREIPFAAGDTFIMHTDGIYEATNAREESYGFDRLTSLAAQTSGDAAAIRDAIVADVALFRGTEPQGDDITIVVARATR